MIQTALRNEMTDPIVRQKKGPNPIPVDRFIYSNTKLFPNWRSGEACTQEVPRGE